MKILVQKFGGTSVVDEKARTAVKDKVQQAIRSGYAPVVWYRPLAARARLMLLIL